MTETIHLGGNINLTGFSEIEPIKLIVVKKMVGRYAKELSEKHKFENLDVTLVKKDKIFEITTKVVCDNPKECIGSANNLFVALDNCFKETQ